MSMRNLFCVGMAAALTVGCGGPPPTGPGEATSVGARSEASTFLRCPDPTVDCTSSNGTGIYYQEGGFAGIDTQKFMLMYFINNGGSVGFQGRYYNPGNGLWYMLTTPGTVTSADWNGTTGYGVSALTESGTYPTWSLIDPVGGGLVYVSGSSLVGLTLHVQYVDPSSGRLMQYLLQYTSYAWEYNNGQYVNKYNLMWRYLNPYYSYVQYCSAADGTPDPVVFQRGMYVNPTSAAVTRNSTTGQYVTQSCRLGAIATAHWWGYDYVDAGLDWYYDSALQMKRASYCGNSKYYTKAGTTILIDDDWGTNWQYNNDSQTEAYWTPTGAWCVNMNKLRHPEMGFNGYCPNGTQLPSCPTLGYVIGSTNQPLLADGLP